MKKEILVGISIIAISIGLVLTNIALTMRTVQPVAGSFSPTGGGTYRLQSSVGTSNTTITLSSLKEPVSNIKYTMSYLGSDIEYGTLDPQTSKPEFISFTGITQNSDGTAQLTGVTRGLTRTPAGTACTASTTLAQSHAAQSIFILSDPPCLFYEYLPARTPATSTAILTFSSTTMPRYDADPGSAAFTAAPTTVLVNMAQLTRTAIAGASNATPILNGLIQVANYKQAASTTATGSTGAYLALTSSISTSTCQFATSSVLTVQANGKLHQNCIDFNQIFIYRGASSTIGSMMSLATTTIAASSTVGNALYLNSLAYAFPSQRGATSTILTENGSGGLYWAVQPTLSVANESADYSTVNPGATTTLKTIAIPAYSITPTSTVKVQADFYRVSGSNACLYSLSIGTGAATTAIAYSNLASASSDGQIQSTLVSTTSAYTSLAASSLGVGPQASQTQFNFTGVRYPTSATLYLDFSVIGSGTETCALFHYSVQRIQ